MGRRYGVLALDLSSATGWAFGDVAAEVPRCGVWQLPPGDLGRLFASFENELEDAITFHKPDLIMVEAALPPTAISNAGVWRQQLGLAALTETATYRHSIAFREQAASTIRKAILGTARFAAGDVKPAVLAYCAAQGWRVPDHNAADACVTWQFTCRELSRRRAA